MAILFFAILLVVSIVFLAASSRVHSETGGQSLLVALTAMTAIGSLIGTVSTVLLAWRADWRTAKECDLKLVQLQQRIKELELKLKGN